MSDVSPALNDEISVVLSTGDAVLLLGAFVITFYVTLCTAFKVQGSADGGSTYNDLESTAMTGNGTTESICLSITRPVGFTHMKVVLTGANARAIVVQSMTRQSPKVNRLTARQKSIQSPGAGTA